MEVQPISCQTAMSLSDPFQCERTQDIRGFVLLDTTLPLLDEQLQINYSTTQHEDNNNVDKLTTEGSPMEDSFDATISQDSNICDNYDNFSLLDTNIKADTQLEDYNDETCMIDEYGDFCISSMNLDNELFFSEEPEIVKISAPTTSKSSSSLSIFDNDEPIIKEDLILSSCCTDNKFVIELKDDTDIGEQVTVSTVCDEESELKPIPLFAHEFSIEIKDNSNVSREPEDVPSLRDSLSMETLYDLNFITGDKETLPINNDDVACLIPETRLTPGKLHLDIAAALIPPPQFMEAAALADTPDVLKPVLDPGFEFDLVNFLLSNNNDTPSSTTTLPCFAPEKAIPEKRKGKNLEQVKESHRRSHQVQTEPVPGPSTLKHKRVRVLNASKDNLHLGPSNFETATKIKRKKIKSLPSCSSLCEGSQRYREKRDKNNVSSKKSRQKRKCLQEQIKLELVELEARNQRLKERSQNLQMKLQKLHTAWKEYLRNLRS